VAGTPRYRRILLKLSGGVLGGEGNPVDPARVAFAAREIVGAREAGAEVAVVVGGGNVVRGRAAREMGWPQPTVDYMGMLATVINALALREGLAAAGVPSHVLAAFGVGECCERYRPERARELLAGGAAVVFAGGTGRPLFTTDTAAALRGVEVGARVLLKATDVDGVYDADPHREQAAQRFPRLGFDEMLKRDLRVMDAAAAALCRDHELPIVVFRWGEAGTVGRIVGGEDIGTYVG
jgi:uridylate kinase